MSYSKMIHTRIAGVCPVYIRDDNSGTRPFYVSSMEEGGASRASTWLQTDGEWGSDAATFATEEEAVAFALSKADWSTEVGGQTAYIMENGGDVQAEPDGTQFYLGTPTQHWSEEEIDGEHWLLTSTYVPDGYATAEEIKAKYGLPPGDAPDRQIQILLGRTLTVLLNNPAPPPNIRGLILQKIGLYVPEGVEDIKQWVLDHQAEIPPPAHGSFRLGDRVRIALGERHMPGRYGFVRGSEGGMIAVEIEGRDPLAGTGTCGSLVPSRRGWWVQDSQLTLAPAGEQQAPLPGIEPEGDVPPPPPVPAEVPRRTYRVYGSYSENVRGTCSYTCTETYSGILALTDERMLDILDGITDRDEMVSAIEDYVRENNNFEGDGGEDYEYEDHEPDNSDGNGDFECENSESILDDFLSNHPELDPDRDEDEEGELPNGLTVGQRVRVNNDRDRAHGLLATVIAPSSRNQEQCAIEVDDGQEQFAGCGHDCDGLVPSGRGWYIQATDLVPLTYLEANP